MQRLGVPVEAADIEVVVRAALEAPHRYISIMTITPLAIFLYAPQCAAELSRWRVVRDLVFPHGKPVPGLSSQTLLQALQVIADAQQYATAIDVFGGLQQDTLSTTKKDPLDLALLLRPLGASVRTGLFV